MRKIFIYTDGAAAPVEEFFRCAEEKICGKLNYQLEYIKEERNLFVEPYVKHFSIEKYRRLYELRIKAAGTMVRVIFYEHSGEVLLLHAFYKHSKKDTEKALETAIKRLNEAINEDGSIPKEHKKEWVK